MKKTIFLFTALISLLVFISSCNGPKIITRAVKWSVANCDTLHVANPLTGTISIHFDCDSIWNASAVARHCAEAKFCIDIAKAGLSGDLDCPGVINIPSIIDSLIPLKK